MQLLELKIMMMEAGFVEWALVEVEILFQLGCSGEVLIHYRPRKKKKRIERRLLKIWQSLQLWYPRK